MANRDTIYIYLVSLTSKGRSQDENTIHADHASVTKFIKDPPINGNCTLYTVPGPYDYVSLVTDITGDNAIDVQRKIEEAGFAKAVLLPGKKADK